VVAYGEVEGTLRAYQDQSLESSASRKVVSTGSFDRAPTQQAWKDAGLDGPRFVVARGTLSAIQEVGFQPFLLVLAQTENVDATPVICRTQNDVQDFITRLAKLPWFPSSRLVRGIERALQNDVDAAVDLLAAWATSPDAGMSETCEASLPPGIVHPFFVGYPTFLVGSSSADLSPAARRRAVLQMLDAYARVPGNDAMRFALIDALGLAASRISQTPEEQDEACKAIERAMLGNPRSARLSSAREAVNGASALRAEQRVASV
jgi:hypothetical protein